MKNYLAIKRNELLAYTTLINLQGIMLTEKNQEKVTTVVLSIPKSLLWLEVGLQSGDIGKCCGLLKGGT